MSSSSTGDAEEQAGTELESVGAGDDDEEDSAVEIQRGEEASLPSNGEKLDALVQLLDNISSDVVLAGAMESAIHMPLGEAKSDPCTLLNAGTFQSLLSFASQAKADAEGGAASHNADAREIGCKISKLKKEKAAHEKEADNFTAKAERLEDMVRSPRSPPSMPPHVLSTLYTLSLHPLSQATKLMEMRPHFHQQMEARPPPLW